MSGPAGPPVRTARERINALWGIEEPACVGHEATPSVGARIACNVTSQRHLTVHCISEARAASDARAASGVRRSALVDEKVAGHSAAIEFSDVYETHFDFVWRSLRLLGVADEVVEDALQDTFSVVSRQLDQFEGRSSLRTWIFAILHRVAANYRRTRTRKHGPLAPLEEMPSDDPTPDAHAEAMEAARSIERFCAGLEPPPAEVAATLGLPIHKVYARVHTLREGLRRELAARDAERG
jgi:RNA polymerase sigma-70 factor (ECF subfamily)